MKKSKMTWIALLLTAVLLVGCVNPQTNDSTGTQTPTVTTGVPTTPTSVPPATEPTEPATQPTEPTTQPTEPTTQPTETPTEPPKEPTEPPTEPAVPLLEQGIAAGESGNLLYIPNIHVEGMVCPEICLYGNGLLLYEMEMDEDESIIRIKRISLEDGSLLAEGTFSMSPAAQVRVGSGCIALYDCVSGQILILDEQLQTIKTYSFPGEGEAWFLNSELEILYIIYPEEGLLAKNLETGENLWIVENATYVRALGAANSDLLISYTARADQKTYARCLNMSTATLETVPLEGALHAGVRTGDQWLLRKDVFSGEYFIIDQDKAGKFYWPLGSMELVSGRRHLLAVDGTFRNLYLFGLDGKFLSQCTLPEIEYASVGADYVWSGYWQGYFFRDTWEEAAHLMFWDPSVPVDGGALAITPVEDVKPTEPVMDASLYKRAAELSERFGIQILIGEQCALDYSHYTTEILADAYFVRIALDMLENALSAYPEGFLRQLAYGDIHEIRIELASTLRAKDDVNDHPAVAGGFAQEMSGYYLIVLDGFSISASTIYHELSHVIDKRLEWDANLRPDALYNEETWLSLQPENFRYAFSYTYMPEDVLAFEYSGYFVRQYSMTFPTEDRATLLSLAMTDSWELSGHPGMVEKMRYYAACIRDCFNTEGWPDQTVWEQGL